MNIKNREKFFENLGYCPQYSALWDDITLKEHLTLYASLKNVSKTKIKCVVNNLMNQLKINDHGDKYSKHLSGGTKRKLAFAISILSEPKITLLDEPSTGMDPTSKRVFCKTISETLKNRSAILTTHSIEEAEKLCKRIGILVKGELKCLGTPSYLKEKFGMGYYLEVKLPLDPLKQNEFFMFLYQLCKQENNLVENFSNRFLYNIPRETIGSLALIFDLLEREKSKGVIIEYSFSQCTLEQVFIKFAKEQSH